jgi:amino acid adenylation domain-containing protein
LSRYSGEDDVVFGVVRRTLSSPPEDTPPPVGLFINTLPMRVRVDASMPLAEWLRQVRAQHLTIRPYKHSPIVDIRQCAEIPGSARLFDTFVVFNHQSLKALLRSGGGSWPRREFRLAESLSSIPLGLYAYADSSFGLKLVHDRDRCSDSLAARLLEHVKCLLSGMAQHADDAVSSLPMLTSSESELLDRWNDTRLDSFTPACVHELIQERVRENPEAVALVSNDGEVTYQELDRRANALAHDLQRVGVGPGVLVGIYLTRSIEMVVSLLATLKAGGAYIPLDPDYPAARLEYMLRDAAARVVLTEERIAAGLPGNLPHVIEVDRATEGEAGSPDAPPTSPVSPTDLAYVIHTSGSTGNPKGVMIEHHNVANFFRAMDERIECAPGGVWLAVTSLSFDISVLELLWTLTKGFTVVIYPGEETDEAAVDATSGGLQLGDYLQNHPVSHMQCTPSMALMMTMDDGCRAGLGSLRQLLIGGEPFPSGLETELHELTGAEIVNMYGPTETTIWSSTHAVPQGHSQSPRDASVVPIGSPVVNTTFYVLDRHFQRVPPGIAGELFIGGEGVARGYLNLESLTAEHFLPDPFDPTPGARIYRTGDLVCHDDNGTVHFLGRIDNQVKIRGHRIEPAEIEEQIQQLAGIEQAAVVAQESAPGEKHLMACVVPTGEMPPSARELREHLKGRLPEYMLPSDYLFLDRLPLTPNKKLDRKALSKLRPEPSAPDAREAPSPGGLEAELAGIWEQVLGPRPIGRDDNFFDLGGNSFLAMKLHHTLRKGRGQKLSLTDIFRYPTVRTLADYLSQQTGDGVAVRAGIDRGRARRLRRKKRMQQKKDRSS